MKTAELVMANGNYVLIRQLTEHGQVDTKPVAATARSAKDQKAVSVLQEDNRVLRQETDRNFQ